MAPKFNVVLAEKAGTIAKVLAEEGLAKAAGDVVCYSVKKSENVSAKKVVALLKGKSITLGDAARKKVGLPLAASGKKAKVKPSDVPAGFELLVQSSSHNRKVPKGSHVLLLPGAASRTSAMKATAMKAKATKGKAMKSVMKSIMKSSARSKGASKETKARVGALLKVFKQTGEVGKPTAASQVPKDAPPAVREMMLAAREWHIQKDSYGVFGLNFFENKKGGYIDKVMLMGDDEMVEQWCKEHSHPNCADESWHCIAAISEYHFIFVNVDASSKDFGATRYIVNNCFEDKPLTKDFDGFLTKVEKFAKTYAAFAAKGDEDAEPPQFPLR